MLAGWLLIPTTASAQTVTFDLDEDRAQALGIGDRIESELTDAAEVELHVIDLDDYLAEFARAAALSSKGMGVDYVSHPKWFTVGAALGSAVSGLSPDLVRDEGSLPDSGFAFMAAVHVGVNLGAFDARDQVSDRFRVFASGLGFRTPSEAAFQAKMWNLGLHLQVDAIRPVTVGTLGGAWGGLQITTGFEHNVYELALTQDLPVSVDILRTTTTWAAEGYYTIHTQANAIPLEVSTSFRFVVFTLFGGCGLDFDFGASSNATAELSGPVRVDVDRAEEPIGTGSVALDGSGEANGGRFRGFYGAQLNIRSVRLYGQANFGIDRTYGVFVGLGVER